MRENQNLNAPHNPSAKQNAHSNTAHAPTHLIDSKNLTPEYTAKLIETAKRIIQSPSDFSDSCRQKIMATLFYEPSTRTRLSFESAMLGLGGNVIGFSQSSSSSAAKGESVADTIRVINSYADICVIRHFKEGAAKVAADFSNIPVINAGDGGHQHPTQTLTDLFTISQEKRRLENLTVGFCGDLKFGRTVHSLVETMSFYNGNRFILISPDELKLPEHIKDDLTKRASRFCETADLTAAMPELDILYMTRVQKERFFNEEDYVRLKDTYILDNQKLQNAKRDLAILHPLPRVNEIAAEVDSDSRALYFKQVEYGRYIRMALILDLLSKQGAN
ncbi:MAG: aspartate carbamoyltransferase [Clostridiales bacterium]|jgi:aspartate carbamoyltransferase catalytic subunit|nr:aspartate carbamoyltransferase [Clostridiales bacterium]